MLALAAAGAGGLPEGTFTISPVSLHLPHGQTSAALKITNSRVAPLAIQAQIFRWTQDGDNDVLVPTSDVILSPPMVAVPSGGVQALRLLMRPSSAAGAARERYYRMLVEEIPGPGARPGDLSFTMRASIPVVVSPAQPISPNLDWHAVRRDGTTVVITIGNTGTSYEKILRLAAVMPDGTVIDAAPVAKNPYVLPGSHRQWTIAPKLVGGTIDLDITTRTGRSKTSLPITP